MDSVNVSSTSGHSRAATLSEPPVLVVQTAFLGDLLLTIPLFQHLRALKPHSPLVLVAREGVGRLLKDIGIVDAVHEIRKGDKASYDAVLSQLRGTVFDWIVCPHQSFTSALFCWKIPARLKISFSQWWNFPFFKNRVQKDPALPEPLRLLSLLRLQDRKLGELLLHCKSVNLKNADRSGRLAVIPDWARLDQRERLCGKASPVPANDRTICLFPGSVWPTKQWTEEGFAALATKLSTDGYQIYWLGSKDEMPATKRLEAKVKGSVSLAGQLSLHQSLVLLAHSRLVISNDSAGQHLAAVAGTPTVSIFGPTILDQGFRPWNSDARVAELVEVKCRPCGKHGHRKCPIGTHACMKKLPADLVYERARQLLIIDP